MDYGHKGGVMTQKFDNIYMAIYILMSILFCTLTVYFVSHMNFQLALFLYINYCIFRTCVEYLGRFLKIPTLIYGEFKEILHLTIDITTLILSLFVLSLY